MHRKKIKVLIVDDSAIVRQALKYIFDSDPFIDVVAVAVNPYFAAKKIQKYKPDVITLDIQMPEMDGLTFLKKIMSQFPTPVIIISSYSEKGSLNAIKALEYGAVDVLDKPLLSDDIVIEKSKRRLCNAVKIASVANIKKRQYQTYTQTPQKKKQPRTQFNTTLKIEKKHSADVIISASKNYPTNFTSDKVIAVGASTGGTEAIKTFLMAMPINAPGIVIVQHMPEKFTLSFANRLNDLCTIRVKEAENGDVIKRGLALIAPGNRHLLVKRRGNQYYVITNDGPLVNRHKPAVDVLFRTMAKYVGKNGIGIIMTGMGADGAKGMLEMKQSGAKTAAQNEQTCVVFGMPKVAILKGGVDEVLPLERLANFALKYSR